MGEKKNIVCKCGKLLGTTSNSSGEWVMRFTVILILKIFLAIG